MKKPVCFRMETGQIDKLKDIAISLKISNGELMRLITENFIDYEITRSIVISGCHIGSQKLHAETYQKEIV